MHSRFFGNTVNCNWLIRNITPSTLIVWPQPLYYSRHKVWSLGDNWLIAAGAYPGFCRKKRRGVFLLPLDGMLVHPRSLPLNLLGFPNNSLVPIYTPGWREALWELSALPKNTTQCPRPGLEPGPLNLGTSWVNSLISSHLAHWLNRLHHVMF